MQSCALSLSITHISDNTILYAPSPSCAGSISRYAQITESLGLCNCAQTAELLPP